MMSKFWKIVKHWKKVVALIEVIKGAAADKKITGNEAKTILGEAIDVLAEMGIIDKE